MTRRREPNHYKETQAEQKRLAAEIMSVEEYSKENPGTIIKGAEFGTRCYYNPDASEDGELRSLIFTETWHQISGSGIVKKRAYSVKWTVVTEESRRPTKTKVESFVDDRDSAIELFNSLRPEDAAEEVFHASDWDGYEEARTKVNEQKQKDPEEETWHGEVREEDFEYMGAEYPSTDPRRR